MTPEKLCELAREAMTHAYVPYSGYQVGAALLCADTLFVKRGAVFSALVLGENIMTVRNLLSLLLVSGGIALANSAAASSKS